MLEHLDHLAETAASAIANVKFDKVIVWDGGNSTPDGGPGGAAGFLRGLAGSLPPALQMMKDIGGVEMPEYFGKLLQDAGVEAKPSEASEEATEEPTDDPGTEPTGESPRTAE